MRTTSTIGHRSRPNPHDKDTHGILIARLRPCPLDSSCIAPLHTPPFALRCRSDDTGERTLNVNSLQLGRAETQALNTDALGVHAWMYCCKGSGTPHKIRQGANMSTFPNTHNRRV